MSKVSIDQTKRLLNEWRRNRKYIREAVPEDLRRAAVEIGRRYGSGIASRELDLSSGLLRGWIKAMTKRRTKKRNTLMRKMAGQSGRASNLDFVEVTPTIRPEQLTHSGQWVEWLRADGARMRVSGAFGAERIVDWAGQFLSGKMMEKSA